MPLSDELKTKINEHALPYLIEEAKQGADTECDKCKAAYDSAKSASEDAAAAAHAAKVVALAKKQLAEQAKTNLDSLVIMLPEAQHEADAMAEAGAPEAKQMADQLASLEAGIVQNQKYSDDAKAAYDESETARAAAQTEADKCAVECTEAKKAHAAAKKARELLDVPGYAQHMCTLEHYDMLGDESAVDAYVAECDLKCATELRDKKQKQLADAEAALAELTT